MRLLFFVPLIILIILILGNKDKDPTLHPPVDLTNVYIVLGIVVLSTVMGVLYFL